MNLVTTTSKRDSMRPQQVRSGRITPLLLLVACMGCASWTNPVANGIPARLVPEDLLAETKTSLKPIPLTWLRRKPDETYQLAAGDIIGVFIDGVLGEPEQLPPINFPDLADSQPSIGFPIPIREDGTLPLPLVDPVKVEGLTVKEAQEAILKAYTLDEENRAKLEKAEAERQNAEDNDSDDDSEDDAKNDPKNDDASANSNTKDKLKLTLADRLKADAENDLGKSDDGDKDILKADEARILVSLIRPRRAKILVVRSDTATGRRAISSSNSLFSSSSPILSSRGQGTGDVVEMPATEADLLSVLTRTGGLPGPDAANEVLILRGYCGESGDWPVGPDGQFTPPSSADLTVARATNDQIIRIPLMVPDGMNAPTFKCEDILLETGDIVHIPPLAANVYYTGGLMASREVPLPRDYDLGVREALLRVGAPMVNGGRGTANLNGNIVNGGVGTPSPSLVSILRKTPDGSQVVIRVDLNRALRDPRENILVKDGDVLLLQETPQEAFARYVAQQLRFQFVGQVLGWGSTTGTGILNLP